MSPIKTTYEKVGYAVRKSGKCPACGKSASRAKKIYQTLNPWNTKEDGTAKSREDIIEELRKEREIWINEPVYHAKCE